jgi:glycerol-1-phosphate dehydrogenase [NAD(P)+]
MSRSGPSIVEALKAARETRALEIGRGVIRSAASVFQSQFGNKTAVIVSDSNTYGVAGKQVEASFQAAKQPLLAPFVFDDPDLYADYRFIDRLQNFLASNDAIPVAVGSGTLNDLTKLASHLTGREYMCVATAASMDGYTAFGASITKDGSKQTFQCPAPKAVVADLDVIQSAPAGLNASGYADLIAKVAAGADWILADALGIEPIHGQAWDIVQLDLRQFVSKPAGVPSREPEAISMLVEGLILGGFAMQAAKTSRAASGAEHQFSHLWDMQHHTHNGAAPSHGFKVGIGTLASIALYDFLFTQPIEKLDIDAACAAWPEPEQFDRDMRAAFPEPELYKIASTEMAAKSITRENLRKQLQQIRSLWPDLKKKLQRQLIPFEELRDDLKAAGAPSSPEEIGITRERLRRSYQMAFFIRRRFTVLDFASRCALLEPALRQIFGLSGRWPLQPAQQRQAVVA